MKSGYKARFNGAAVGLLLCLITASCSSTKALIVLLPEEGGSRGAIAVGQGQTATVLDVPMTAARVDDRGMIEKGPITREEVEREFGQALAAQPPQPISFILYFEEGSTVILEDSRKTLRDLLSEVARRQGVEVQVTGHTDTMGSEADNDRLSAERAQAVKKMLIEQGLQTKFVRAVGRGERELLIPTPDGIREPRNRRVQVIVR